MNTLTIGEVRIEQTNGIGIDMHKVIITPENAADILENTTLTNGWKNRRVSLRHVSRIKDSFKDDGIILTHQGIAFSDKGNLIDGQHRLMSCAESGIPFKTLLFTNVPESVVEVIDTNKTRSFPDNLQMMGVTCTSLVSGISNLCQQFDRNKNTTRIVRNYCSIKQKMKFFFENRKDIENAVKYANKIRVRHPNVPFNNSEFGFMHVQLFKISSEKAICFLSNLVLEADHGEGNVFARANNVLGQIKRRYLTCVSRKHETVHIMIECWNEFVSDGKYRTDFFIDSEKSRNLPDIAC